MVRSAIFSLLIAVSLAPPAGAQNVLKQLQSEVAAISAKTRRAVVTVEDSPVVTQVLPLRYRVSEELARTLNARMKDSSRVLSDARTNSLIITGVPGTLSKVQDVVSKLDRPDDTRLQQDLSKKSSEDKVLRELPQTTSPTGKSGSGFSIGDGYVVTTADVVEGMVNPIVVTDTGARIKASVVGADKELNVGLIRLSAQFDIPSLTLGDSSKVEVGHFAVSIGNQTGQDNSVALMLVGGIRKEGSYSGEHFYPSLIQIAGTVGAGTSGAPLVNADGEVIGIVAAMPSDDYLTWQAVPGAAPNPQTFANPTRTLAMRDQQVGKPVADEKKSAFGLGGGGFQGASGPAGQAGQGGQAAKQTDKDSFGRGGATRRVATDPEKGKKEAEKPAPSRLRSEPVRERGFAEKSSDSYLQLPQQQPNVLLNYESLGVNQANGAADLSNFFVSSLRPSVTSAGFAVPINELKLTIEALKSGKEVVRGWIGMDLKDEQTDQMTNGVVRAIPHVRVGGLYANSPAVKSGIQPGDILLELNGEEVGTGAAVRAAILRITPPKVVDAVVEREGHRQTVKVAVEPRPKDVKADLIREPITPTKK